MLEKIPIAEEALGLILKILLKQETLFKRISVYELIWGRISHYFPHPHLLYEVPVFAIAIFKCVTWSLLVFDSPLTRAVG